MPSPAWHARSGADALAALDGSSAGLLADEARRRLERHGPNRFAPPAPVSVFRILAAQFTSVIVGLLAVAAGVAVAVGDLLDAAVIGAVLLINATIGFWTEWRARLSIDALLRLDVPRAFVVRGGQVGRIDAAEVVPGDLVELRAGGHVPADGRLVESADLRIDEAALTGESLPVSKRADDVLVDETPLGERRNMVYKGTTVVAGLARAVVTATGVSTEVGRIGSMTGEVRAARTPLERRLDALGRRLVWLALGAAVLVMLLGALQGLALPLAVQTGIALAVAAVPEALPAVATIALAVGVRRMARRRAIVRRLPAVEALGSTTVVCTDKTRTLTSGEMTVVRIWTPAGEWHPGDGQTLSAGAVDVLRCASRASHPRTVEVAGDRITGDDPVDAAIRRAAEALAPAGDRETVAVLPFSSERKLMAAFDRQAGVLTASVKGAPRQVLDRVGRIAGSGGPQRLGDADRTRLDDVNDSLARDGLRVLAVAEGDVREPSEAALDGLTFLGFIGLADPPAPRVVDTVRRLGRAGLRTVMLTGDQRGTAAAVGRQIGLLGADDPVVDARELHRGAAGEGAALIGRVNAFSRVSPEDKLTIVRTLQARGEVVAMLGDGINDAAALKQADVGIAMGRRGTDVAKQASAIVLQDDRFETVAAAVEEGRIIFDNIRKFVFYLFSCNVAEVLTLLGAGLVRLPLPLLPLQLLWLNLVTDTFPALALALEPGEERVMERPPRRPDAVILSRRFVTTVLFYGGMITAATLGAYVWALAAAPDRATTVAFMTISLAQIAHLGNARRASAVLDPASATSNPYALAAVGLSVGLQVAAVSIGPLADVLSLSALTWGDWTVVLLAAAAPAVVGQALRLGRSRRS